MRQGSGIVVARRAILTIAVLGLQACGQSSHPMDPKPERLDGSASADIGHEIVRESFDFTQFNVCLGEEVHWTGEIQVVKHFTNNRGCCDDGIFQHLVENSRLKLDGLGEDTGKRYSLTGRGVPRDDFCFVFGLPTPCVFDFGFQSPDPVNPFPVAGRPIGAQQSIRSPGEGLVAEALFKSIFIVNANGEVVVFKETLRNPECFVTPPPIELPF